MPKNPIMLSKTFDNTTLKIINNPEISLYTLLMVIDIFYSYKEWIEAYEYGVEIKHIQPRQKLMDKYERYKNEV